MSDLLKRFRVLAAIFAIVALSFAMAACGDDDDDPTAEPDPVTDGTTEPGAEPDPETDPDPEADPDPEPDPEAADLAPGVVEPKPEDATQVDVTLTEWSIELRQPTVAAGKFYFLVENAGPEDAHEFVVIRSEEAPADLPTEEGRVPEDKVILVNEIEPFLPDSSASLVLSLDAGNYVLICNIAEVEEGELESHYELGMRTSFVVE